MEILGEDERAKIQNEYEQIFGDNQEKTEENEEVEQLEEDAQETKNAEESAKLFIEQFLEEPRRKIKLVIDRFEGNIAVCENRETEEMTNINIEELPEDVTEGDVLSYDGIEYEIDEEAKKEIEERIKNKIKNLFEEN